MNTLIDSPALRARRAAAYNAGRYTFTPPPVCCASWDEQAWCNWVQFDNPALTGFLPYVKTVFTAHTVPAVA